MPLGLICWNFVGGAIKKKVFDIKCLQGLFWSIPRGLNVLMWYSGTSFNHFWVFSTKKPTNFSTKSKLSGISVKIATTAYDTKQDHQYALYTLQHCNFNTTWSNNLIVILICYTPTWFIEILSYFLHF